MTPLLLPQFRWRALLGAFLCSLVFCSGCYEGPPPPPASGLSSELGDSEEFFGMTDVDTGLGGMGGAGRGQETGWFPQDCDGEPCGGRVDCEEIDGETLCRCKEGFGGQRCEDINECAAVENPCAGHATCVNTPGSYSCVCELGFEEVDGKCVDIDECARGAQSPCAPEALCENQEGGFACTCKGKQVGDGHFCKEEEDCEDDNCEGGVCVETASAYVCQCPVGRTGVHGCEKRCDTLELPPALDAWVRLMIGKPTEPLIPSDVAGVNSLFARDLELDSIAGLECWPGLRELDLSGNELSGDDLGPLAMLNELETLRLDCNPIDHLDALGEHPDLRVFSASQAGPECDNDLVDVGALRGATGLRSLSLSGNRVTELAPVATLRALRHLDLSDNGLSTLDPVVLQALPLVEELLLADNGVSSWGFLESGAGLRVLDVSNNPLSSLEGVESATALEVLRARGLGVTSLAPLSSLSRLRELDLAFNFIGALGSLENLRALYFLNLQSNQIESVAPLLQTEHLGTLLLDNNPLACLPDIYDEQEHNVQRLVAGGTWVTVTCSQAL